MKLPCAAKSAVILPATLAMVLANSADDGVAKTAAEAKPLAVGQRLPEVNLTTLEGKTRLLKDIVADKPSVIVFYRGGWCPFCNAHLAELGKVEAEVRSKGFQIIAISPDTPQELNKTLDKSHLTYSLFSDSSADAMKKFGIAFRVDDDTVKMYRERFNIDLERASGQNHHILPVPAVFVIKRGVITYQFADPDYKVRLKGSDLLKALEK